THSRKLVSIRLLRKMGIKSTLQYISRFGFEEDELPRDLSLALGSGAITPLQMAEGYSILANGGYHVSPYYIERIEDDNHNIVYQANPEIVCDEEQTARPEEATTDLVDEQLPVRCAARVITPQNHYLMNSMMRDVIQHGTAKLARTLGRKDLAGKTGTTNDQRDAWFNGFNRHLVAITWVGFDDFTPLGRGEVGGRAALPAWIDFMRIALDGVNEELPDLPPEMVTMRIDVDTGKPVGAGAKNAIFEIFREAYAPPLPLSGAGFPGSGKPGKPLAVDPAEDPF
ncbi:MAG: penicillin-binding transpeptidase domain-containing protein, partial [Pseudomonadota bacterium]